MNLINDEDMAYVVVSWITSEPTAWLRYYVMHRQ